LSDSYKNVENILGAIKCNHFVEVVWVDQEIVVEVKLGRLQENSALIDGECQVVIDCIIHVSMVDRYLTMP